MKSMKKSGRAMSGWPVNDGGIPPNLDKVTNTSRSTMDKFVDHLLGSHKGLSKDLKYLLVANGIRFFSDFIKVLEKEPSKKYSSIDDMKTKHVFVNRVSLLHF